MRTTSKTLLNVQTRASSPARSRTLRAAVGGTRGCVNCSRAVGVGALAVALESECDYQMPQQWPYRMPPSYTYIDLLEGMSGRVSPRAASAARTRAEIWDVR